MAYFCRYAGYAVFALLIIFNHSAAEALNNSYPKNEVPMYGDPEAAIKDARNQGFVNKVLATGTTRIEASRHAEQRGWEALRHGDFGIAMQRFNQAWLLNDRNGGAYWGMAATVSNRDQDNVQADTLFQQAIEYLPHEADLYVDYGRMLGRRSWMDRRGGNQEAARRDLEASNEAFRKALSLDDKARNAHPGLATNYLLAGDLAAAYRHADIAVARGETRGFNALSVLQCLQQKGVTDLSAPAARACGI